MYHVFREILWSEVRFDEPFDIACESWSFILKKSEDRILESLNDILLFME